MAYSIGKKTIIILDGADKTFCLNGFWSEEAIRKYAARRNFVGKVFASYHILHYGKYGLDRTEKRFELEV